MKNNKKYLISVLAVVAIVLLFTAPTPVTAGGTGDSYPPPSTGDWLINSTVVVANETIVVTGSVIITDGGSLTLINTTLKINNTIGTYYDISVECGGHLNVINSTITALDTNYRYDLLAFNGSRLHIVNSEISYTGHNHYNFGKHSGIWINTFNANIINAKIHHSYYGIYLYEAFNITITNVTLSDIDMYGIYIDESTNIEIQESTILTSNRPGVYVWGYKESHFNHTIDSTNNVNGYPVYFVFNERDLVFDGITAATFIVAFSDNITLKNALILSDGVYVWYSHSFSMLDTTIPTSTYMGIYLRFSDGGRIASNVIHDTTFYTLYALHSPNFIIENNTLYNSIECLYLEYANNSIVRYNNGFNNTYGINVWYTHHSLFEYNRLHDNEMQGIYLLYSTDNTIRFNDIYNNKYGLYVDPSENNLIYMNNIMNNTYQAYFRGTIHPNSWDNGTFGNYWSDYNGTDANRDGIGDTPYYINDDNIDHYPLMFRFETYYGAPTITDISWSPHNPLPTENVYVIANVTDPNGISKVLLYYKAGTLDWAWNEMILLENGSYYGSIPNFSANTVVLFKIVANDTLGNTAESDVYSYTVVDNEPPTISNVTWTPLEPIHNETVTVIAYINDSGGIDSVILSYIHGELEEWNNVTMSLVNGAYVGTIPAYPETTPIYFRIIATDTVGNEAVSAIYHYTVKDVLPPTIVSLTYSPFEPTDKDTVTVSVQLTDPSGISVAILSYNKSDTWVNVTMSFDGENYLGTIEAFPETTLVQFRIYANDTAGNLLISALYSYTVIDVNPPVINSVTWVPESPSSNDNVTVYVNTTDPSGISTVILSYTPDVGWLNVTMTLEDGLYVATIPAFPASTLVQFLITVNDTVGNRVESEIFSYTVSDVDPPQISSVVWSPTEPLYNETVTVVATITDESDIASVILAYQVNNTLFEVSMTLLGDNYQATIPKRSENTTVIFWVYAEDAYGNSANSSTYQYTVPDITPPSIIDIQQLPSQPKAYDIVTIKASIFDNVSIDVVWLNYSLDQLHWTTVIMSFDDSVFVGTIPQQLEYSTVYFVIYANDTSGNMVTSSILSYFIVDSTDPNIEGVLWVPTTPNSEENVLVLANITDDSELSVVLLSYFNGTHWVNVSMSLLNESYTGVIPALLAGTTVQFKIYAQDNFGNWGISETYSYTVIPVSNASSSLNSSPDIVTTLGILAAGSATTALAGYGIYRKRRKI